MDLAIWRAAAEDAARIGAAELERWRSKFVIRDKGRADLVTDADVASQKLIRDYLLGRFPDHHFLGEEDGGAVVRPKPGDPPLWIVDPLDGTTNYAHDCPLYCVSVGLWAGGDVVAGAIYDPRQRELFSAATGLGATLDGQPLRVSQADDLGDALLASGFSADLTNDRVQLPAWQRLSLRAQSVRRTGSTALNLAYVAAGRFDGFWAYTNNAWDVAAGIVLVREAGGSVSGLSGQPHVTFQPDMIASNGPIHAALVAEIAAVGSSD